MTVSTAVVLAAGKSTRIHPIAQGLPKPLIQIEGTPIIARNLRWLASQGIQDVHINLHYKPDEVIAVLKKNGNYGLDIHYYVEDQLLGTAGGVKNIAANGMPTDSSFAVVYGDNLLNFPLRDLNTALATTRAVASIALFDRKIHKHTGIAGGRVVKRSDGTVERFAEGADDAISSLVNAGVYICRAEILDYIPAGEFYDFGHDVFPQLLRDNQQLATTVIDGYCLGIDTPESYEAATQLVRTGEVTLS